MIILKTSEDVTAWLASAKPKTSAIYHIGMLAADREAVIDGRRHLYSCNGTGLTAWLAYVKGEVELSQKREDQHVFSYIITKRRWRRKV